VAAERAGADRLELCGPSAGGVTPSPALMGDVMAAVRIPVHVMFRPREGDFTCTPAEFESMERAVDRAKEAGVAGVVFGVLRADGTLAASRMGALLARARPMRVGCHRAFDSTPEPDLALETLLTLGVDLVLTSGHAKTALEGAATLARHVAKAGDRMTILAGGGVRGPTAKALVAASGVREVHARGTDALVIAELAAVLKP
jgi:copper homeostasis protein